jgi:hypothetical protein
MEMKTPSINLSIGSTRGEDGDGDIKRNCLCIQRQILTASPLLA